MGLEIRAATSEEMEEFVRIVSTAMVLPAERFKEMRPEWTLCAFEDGKLTTTYAAWPLTMRFNGNGLPVAGVTMVSTLPNYRRRGHLRQVIARHLELLHEERHQPVAILQAYWAATYHRYGYAVVSWQNSYTLEPRYLEFAIEQPVTGTLREVDNEFQLFVDLYRCFRAERTGYLHRGRAMWEAGMLAPPPAGSVLSKFVYQEAGEPLGYVIYTVEPATGGPPTQRLTIRELVWLTPSAYRALWNLFIPMDLVANIIWPWVPVDDPLPHLLLEPKMLHITSKDGLMARIVDVEPALLGRQYDEEGTLIFEIADELCPWNQGRWKLEATPAEAAVSPTRAEPQLAMPISTLAMLVFGQISATEAARMQRLSVLDHNALPIWDRVMRTAYKPFCADVF